MKNLDWQGQQNDEGNGDGSFSLIHSLGKHSMRAYEQAWDASYKVVPVSQAVGREGQN